MKSIYQKILRRGVFVAVMLALCGIGIRVAVARSDANAPDALPAAAQSDLVIVLDAGHGEST